MGGFHVSDAKRASTLLCSRIRRGYDMTRRERERMNTLAAPLLVSGRSLPEQRYSRRDATRINTWNSKCIAFT